MQQFAFAPEDSESVLRMLEGASQVRRRYQFFLWLQADLQRLLPHKLAVCGAWDRSVRELVFEPLHSVPLQPDLLTSLGDARLGLTQHLIAAWQEARQQALQIDLAALDSAGGTAHGLITAGYHSLCVHGVSRPARPAELESFFVFGLPHVASSDKATRALSMLMPYLHATYLRVREQERELGGGSSVVPGATAPTGRGVAITEREREILRWVREGLSNQQIGEALSISALTVKNHVQKILRKLSAANRAQAVAKAMAMNLFSSSVPQAPMREAGDSRPSTLL